MNRIWKIRKDVWARLPKPASPSFYVLPGFMEMSDTVIRGIKTPLAAIALVASWSAAVLGAAPMAKTQPGFYRMMLGDFEVTALNDGVVAYPTARVLPLATPAQIKEGLAASGLTDPVPMSYNAFLINTGSKLVLI